MVGGVSLRPLSAGSATALFPKIWPILGAVSESGGAALFPSTRWSLILAAQGDEALRSKALEELVRPRWKALYVLARQHGLAPAAAEDAVQSFLARLVEVDMELLLGRLDPAQGSLRSYLKTAFRRHLSNVRQHDRAQKRGAGERHADVSTLEAWLDSGSPSADRLYERAWALAVFEQALAELEHEYVSGARRGPFDVVRALFAYGTAPAYVDLARDYGMTVPQLKSFVHRAKRRFRTLLEAQVADTLCDGEDTSAEVSRLLEVLTS